MKGNVSENNWLFDCFADVKNFVFMIFAYLMEWKTLQFFFFSFSREAGNDRVIWRVILCVALPLLNPSQKIRIPLFYIRPEDKKEGGSLRSRLRKVLKFLYKKEDVSWPFREAVDEKEAPNYYARIAHPMDLSKMEEKVERGKYASVAQFEKDLLLIINNCKTYNGPESGKSL
jgi:hypothetical protein